MNHIRYYKIDPEVTSFSSVYNHSYSHTRVSELPSDLTRFIQENSESIIQKFTTPYSDSIYNKYYQYYSTMVDSSNSFVFPQLKTFVFTAKKTRECTEALLSAPNFEGVNTDIFSKFYPIAVRYTNGRNIWLIERPPFQANITFKPSRSYSKASFSFKNYTIWMPWTVMLIDMDPTQSYYKSYLFFNDSPLNSLDDTIVPCFFPNMYNDGSMCLNETSILLQQYLSEIQSFNISDVYNFLINDYMMGGWNTDLSINVFDNVVNYVNRVHKYIDPSNFDTSVSLSEINSIIYNGDGTKKYKSVYGRSTYRYSVPKLINNFLTYMSDMSLDQMLGLVSSIKNTLDFKKFAPGEPLESDNVHRILKPSFPTYRTLIDTIELNSVSSLNLSYIFSEPNHNQSYFSSEYMILIDSKLYDAMRSGDNCQEIRKSLISNLNSFILDLNKSSVEKMLTSEHMYSDTMFSTQNPFIYVKDLDNIYSIGRNDSCSIIYDGILNNEAVLNDSH